MVDCARLLPPGEVGRSVAVAGLRGKVAVFGRASAHEGILEGGEEAALVEGNCIQLLGVELVGLLNLDLLAHLDPPVL